MENWGDFSNITKDFSSKIYEKNHERVEFGDLEVNIMRFEINNTNLHSDLDKIILNAQKQYGYEISQSCTQADSYSVYVNLTNTKISRKTSDFTLCLLTPYTDIYPAKLTIDVNLKDNQMWEIKTT